MDETTKKRVDEVLAKSRSVNSYVARFTSNVEHVMLSSNSTGRLYYRHPDSIRVERISGGKSSIEVYVRDKMSRFVEGEKIIYECDLSEVVVPEQFRFANGFRKVHDPFKGIDMESIKYHGTAVVEGVSVYAFAGEIRREFETFGKQYTLDMQIETKVSMETGLVLEHELSTKALGVTSKSHSVFSVIEINGDIDESLFSIDVLGKEIRHADITEMIRDGMNPFDRNVGASNN